jgi:hypothetical protein
MKKDGSFAKMGMTETDLYKFYSQAQLNNDPMYKYVNTVDGWVKNKLISQDDADDMIALFKYNLTNPNGLEVLDGFAVKDKGGKEVGFFTTQADADKFITTNKDKGYVSTPVKNHVGVKGSSGGGGGGGGGGGTLLTDQEEHTKFIDALPSDAPSNAAEWLNVDLWKASGKPKTWKDFQSWYKDTPKITEYLKKKYNSDTPDLTNPNISKEDKSLIIQSIKENSDLADRYKMTDEDINTIDNRMVLEQNYKIDTDGSYIYRKWAKSGHSKPEDELYKDMDNIFTKVKKGRVMEINNPNGGKQKIMILGTMTDDKGHLNLNCIDINTGSVFNIKQQVVIT